MFLSFIVIFFILYMIICSCYVTVTNTNCIYSYDNVTTLRCTTTTDVLETILLNRYDTRLQKKLFFVKLYITSEVLTTIPDGIFSNSSLTFLSIHGCNKLTEINNVNAFSGLAMLVTLYLNDNNLQTLASGLFRNLISLKYLSLSNNKIIKFGKLELPRLQQFNIQYNKLP